MPFGLTEREAEEVNAGWAKSQEDMRRREQLRIQALGAAISRRDWHAATEAYNAIRDFFDGPQGQKRPYLSVNECKSCGRMFVDGETCSRGGCPMGGDF